VNALGWACLYGAFLLDKVDGEVACYCGQQSVTGILLDRFHHRLVEPPAVPRGGLAGVRRRGGRPGDRPLDR
jgi:hypothetical protein